MRHEHVPSFLCVYFWAIFLSNIQFNFCVFLYNIYVFTQYIIIISINKQLMCPIRFQSLCFLGPAWSCILKQSLRAMAIKNISLFQTILNRRCIGQMFTFSDLTFRFMKNILISLTNFIGMPISMRMLNTSLQTESQTSLKSINSWWIVPLHSHFFSSVWRIQNMLSVVDLLRWNQHW
jgi:hypothetical protein